MCRTPRSFMPYGKRTAKGDPQRNAFASRRYPPLCRSAALPQKAVASAAIRDTISSAHAERDHPRAALTDKTVSATATPTAVPAATQCPESTASGNRLHLFCKTIPYFSKFGRGICRIFSYLCFPVCVISYPYVPPCSSACFSRRAVVPRPKGRTASQPACETPPYTPRKRNRPRVSIGPPPPNGSASVPATPI